MLPKESELPEAAFGLPPVEYLGLVETVNTTILKEHQLLLSDMTLSEYQAVIVIGSDGKLERHTQSKTEFVFLQFEKDPFRAAYRITQKLRQYPLNYEVGPRGMIEVRDVTDPTPLSWAYGDRTLVYPDRLLNAALVIGNPQTACVARLKVLYEMSLDPRHAGRLLEHMTDQLALYKRAIRQGKYRGQPVFSSNEAKQYYNEGRHMTFGFKSSFLRAVQRKLDILTARLIRDGVWELEQAARIPTQTYKRLDSFATLGILTGEEAEGLTQAYGWFLREYHRVQETYKRTRRPVALPFNLDYFHCYALKIDQFVEAPYQA